MIAQTVVYRSSTRSLSLDFIIREPGQYQGLESIDLPAYMRVRRKELSENLMLASAAIFIGRPTINVSHFASNEPEWARRCELKYVMVEHKFYLCPE